MEATIYAELNDLLASFTAHIQRILGADLVGAYVVGSFALRDGDMSSDCDFLVVTDRQVGGEREEALRVLHDEIPSRPGYWAINFEGSYAPKADLESLDRLDRSWLYVNRGGREMEWSTHCNVLDTRWVLRNHGIVLTGPAPASFAAEVPGALLQERMQHLIPGFLDDLRTWASFDLVWTQRYTVETLCRMLYTFVTGEVASKRASLEWGRRALDQRWERLIASALDERSVPWNAPSDPAKVEASISFARFATDYVSGFGSSDLTPPVRS